MLFLAGLLVLLGGCGAAEAAAVDDIPQDTVGVALRVETTTPTTVPPVTLPPGPVATATTLPDDRFRTLIATAKPRVTELVVFERPNGPQAQLPFRVSNPHQFGGPLTLMITEGSIGDSWLKVQLPVRPNGLEGWIWADDFEIGHTRIRAQVDLSTRRVQVFDGDEVIIESLSVIGASATPTPLGTFYVAAKRENPDAEYYLGPKALVLSGYSEALESFTGGLPVIAIHGTDRPDQVGEDISYGCVRVPNDIIELLYVHVPLGAPVYVST